jgi:hypothetical protein
MIGSVEEMSPSPINEFFNNHPRWTEVIVGVSITVVGTAVISFVVWIFKALGQSTSLRVGANWTLERATSDSAHMTLHPNVNVVSRSNAPKKIVHSIWVRESKNIHKPGKIYGKVDLVNHIPIENRTTGGDPLNLVGPTIKFANSDREAEEIMHCPIWIQTSDDRWYKAQSMGNPPNFAERLRCRLRR